MVQDRGESQAEDEKKIGKDNAKKEHDIVAFILQDDPKSESGEEGQDMRKAHGLPPLTSGQISAQESQRR